jgi:hypothetical protein
MKPQFPLDRIVGEKYALVDCQDCDFGRITRPPILPAYEMNSHFLATGHTIVLSIEVAT